jgi:hypothetical protein
MIILATNISGFASAISGNFKIIQLLARFHLPMVLILLIPRPGRYIPLGFSLKEGPITIPVNLFKKNSMSQQ